uniref:Uncharacterized protein n=1 Tax=Anguilla anguilla TaxID=7936 RepID=A0A0E9S9E8_ANGAN
MLGTKTEDQWLNRSRERGVVRPWPMRAALHCRSSRRRTPPWNTPHR